MPLKVVESPYREITKPILQYVKRIRTDNPRDVVTVFIPEYVLGRWWEQLLHNQSALRLKGRLLFQPGVMVVSVPWQLSPRSGRRPAVPPARRDRRAAATSPRPVPAGPRYRPTPPRPPPSPATAGRSPSRRPAAGPDETPARPR